MTEHRRTQGLVHRPDERRLAGAGSVRRALARVGRTVVAVAGAGTTLLSGAAIAEGLIHRADDPLALTILGCTLFAGLGTAGAWVARRMFRMQANVDVSSIYADAIRQRLLAVASLHRGRLTAAELAATLGIAPEPSERALEEAAKSGLARLLVSPEGVEVYEFPGLLAAKADAKELWQL